MKEQQLNDDYNSDNDDYYNQIDIIKSCNYKEPETELVQGAIESIIEKTKYYHPQDELFDNILIKND
jgi:hypothetical protein